MAVVGNGNEEDGLGRNHGRFANGYACANWTVNMIHIWTSILSLC